MPRLLCKRPFAISTYSGFSSHRIAFRFKLFETCAAICSNVFEKSKMKNEIGEIENGITQHNTIKNEHKIKQMEC